MDHSSIGRKKRCGWNWVRKPLFGVFGVSGNIGLDAPIVQQSLYAGELWGLQNKANSLNDLGGLAELAINKDHRLS